MGHIELVTPVSHIWYVKGVHLSLDLLLICLIEIWKKLYISFLC